MSGGFDFAVPVLIAGGGACGAVAALAAREAGAEVLLVEQDAAPFGSTSLSQGLICAGGTRSQAACGVEDGPDRFYADILEKTRGETDPALARAVADAAGETVDWLAERCDLPYALDVRFKAAWGHSVARVHGWPGRGGAEVLQAMHARLGERGVDVLTGARLTEVVADVEGRVSGVELERPDGARERIGCGALVLATGGFAGRADLVARHMPEAVHAIRHAHEGSRGDALTFGRKLGAATGDLGAYQGYGMLTEPQAISVPPPVLIEGAVMVNATGARFVDESADIAGVLHPVLAQPNAQAWVVFDAAIEARCAHIPEMQSLTALHAAKTGGSVEELAAAMGVDPAALAATLAEAWTARRAGAADALGRSWGDAPPPSAPYRALRVKGALYHTQGGLQVDARARVLRPDGRALPNLYAAGGAARGLAGPSYWGYLPAMGLCAAVTLGRLAGRDAAALPV